ncbi:MAG TPA: T9SS type A sorting domain-containing protein [bacterium]
MMKIHRVFIALAAVAMIALAIEAGTPGTPQNTRAREIAVYSRDHGNALDSTGEVLRTISVPVPAPNNLGVSIAADCDGHLYYTNYLVPQLYQITATGELVDSVALHTSAGTPVNIDEIVWDQSRGLLWGAEDATFRIFLIDPATGLCTFQFTGLVQEPPIRVNDGLAIDPTNGTIWHSPDVSDSIGHFSSSGVYLGSLIPLGPTGQPDRDISGIVVGTGNRMFVGHDGQGRVSVVNKLTGVWIRDLVTLPARLQGMECDAVNFAPNVVLWVRNGLNNTLYAVQLDSGACACAISQDTCQFLYTQVDMGNLPACGYPTLPNNPGHGLSGIAWLGACVSGDTTPHADGLDSCNDGVTFLNAPWTPCEMESVMVTVTAGPNFPRYQNCGGQLYLNAWKDGNLNGTFCDEIACPNGVASEWMIQDLPVTPGLHTIAVRDPGVTNMGVYAGVFRFRLTSRPVGRFGFGLRDTVACPAATCGTFALDMLGEVEDYMLPDFQLAVTLNSLDAAAGDGSVVLRWVTASENANDHFEILRDGHNIARVASQGNGPAERSYRYSDEHLVNGTSYSYVLAAVDVNGHRTELRTVSATPTANADVITDYALAQNYPNPFNPTTEISYDLKDAGFVQLRIFNLLGQDVSTLVNASMPQGRHRVIFDASALPSGVYLYRIDVNGFVSEKKMLLLK